MGIWYLKEKATPTKPETSKSFVTEICAIHAKNGLLEFIIEQHTLKRPKYLESTENHRQTPTKIPTHYFAFKGCEQKN